MRARSSAQRPVRKSHSERFGAFVVLDKAPTSGRASTPGEFAPAPLVRMRAAKIAPFDAGPFALYRLAADADAVGWRVAVRDMLRVQNQRPPHAQEPMRRLPLLEFGGVDDQVPFFFVTPFVFGIPLSVVVDRLDQRRGTAPNGIARVFVDDLMAHVRGGIERDLQELRPRLARPDALYVSRTGHVVDFCSAPYPLSRGPAAGHIDFDRAARAYGALLARVPSTVTEQPAFNLLQSANGALDWQPVASETDRHALAAFVQTQFREGLEAHENAIEQHALLDVTSLNRLAGVPTD